MSGRRQHYLPQFLQRPFAHRRSGNQSYVYVHRIDTHFVSSTSGVGVEKDFYSGPEDTTADDNVTKAEEGHVETLSSILQKQYIDESDDIAAVIALLSIRTLKMREAMRELVPQFSDGIKHLASQDEITSGVINQRITDRAWLNKQIDKLARENGIRDRNRIAMARAYFRPRLEAELASRKEEIARQLNHLVLICVDRLKSEASEFADSTFEKIFKSSDSLAKRRTMFSDFSYRLLSSQNKEYILGDCAVVATDGSGEACLALADSDEHVRLSCIYLPISHNTAIFGSRDPSTTPLEPDQINLLSASLSFRFFISYGQPTDETSNLRNHIGTSSGINFDLTQIMASSRAP